MAHHDAVSVSRVSSRTSKHGSTRSRSQSLIQKNTAPHDLRPSDVLIERFVAWKAIVKQLISYFEGIAEIETHAAREMTKLAGVIQVPFRSGNQFLGEGGIQDVFYSIRDQTRLIGDQHANLGRTVEHSIVQHLQKLRMEIKAHIKNVQNDTGKLATNIAKERELSAKLISELSSSIGVLKSTPMGVTTKTDPYITNTNVMRQLRQQVNEENALQKSIIIMQQNSADFETLLVRSIQSTWQTFEEWQTRMSASVQGTWKHLGEAMDNLEPDREWVSFSARSEHLIDPETPLRDPEAIRYPCKEDPSVIPVHTGHLERKKRFTRAYRESYFVLTAAGFLHEYSSSDPAAPGGSTPMFSLFLPACTLGPPSSLSAESHKFHIEGRKDGSGTTKTGSLRRLTQSGSHAWSFRARSHEDMMEWWNDIKMLCARYLVASEQMDRSGSVAAAVRSAGYLSEDEDDEDGTDNAGSSVEAEDEEQDDDEEENYESAGEGQDDSPNGAPSNSRSEKTSMTVVGSNGHTAEKKNHRNGDKDLERRPSKRQQEKAAEGRSPREAGHEAGHEGEGSHGGAESRFKEDI